MEARSRAAALFNRCWELLELPADPARDAELIASALGSRELWLTAGGPQQWATADWMVSRAYVATGQSGPAVAAAKSSFEHPVADFPYWLQASLFEGLARAQMMAGDRQSAEAAAAECRRLLTLELDAEDAALIASQLAELNL